MKKILADESVDFRIVKSLRSEEYDVEAILELSPGISDEEVLKMSLDLDALLMTEDKDFGELTYRLKRPNKGIILLRMGSEKIDDRIRVIKKVLLGYGNKLENKFTVISIKKIRIIDSQ